MRKKYKGFTLIELLVVIAIIAILMSILMPGLRAAREQAKKVTCQANMKGIGTSMSMYLMENSDRLSRQPNWGQWDNQWAIDLKGDATPFYDYQPKHLQMNDTSLDPWNPYSYAYWGAAYRDYTDRKEIYHCPDAGEMDDWRDDNDIYGFGPEYQQYFYYSTYGCNAFLDGVKVASLNRAPEDLVFAMDHIEQRLEANDLPSYNPPIQGWRYYNWGVCWPLDYGFWQAWRHMDRFSDLLWLDGHVSHYELSSLGVDDPGDNFHLASFNPDASYLD